MMLLGRRGGYNSSFPVKYFTTALVVWSCRSSSPYYASISTTASAVPETSSSNIKQKQSDFICSNADQQLPFGCLLRPMDVHYDEDAKAALKILRRTTDFDTKDDKEVSDSLATLGQAGDWDKSTLTLCGYKGGPVDQQINQDRAIVLSPFVLPRTDGSLAEETNDGNSIQLVGVFDGHGDSGEVTSEHASTTIPRLISEKLATLSSSSRPDDSVISAAIQEAFVETDRSDPTKGVGGCTATIILQWGTKLYVGNAGDSRSMIVVQPIRRRKEAAADANNNNDIDSFDDYNTPPEVYYASREDKPDLPEEQKRITQAGGYVHIPADPQEDVPRAYYVDDQGRAMYGLAMSRSLGDWSVQGVIPEPIVDVIDIKDILKSVAASNDSSIVDLGVLAVSATDGMIDYLNLDNIADVLASSFFPHAESGGKPSKGGVQVVHPHVASQTLIARAAAGWQEDYQGEYRDDIAIATSRIHVDRQLVNQILRPNHDNSGVKDPVGAEL